MGTVTAYLSGIIRHSGILAGQIIVASALGAGGLYGWRMTIL